jgi:hypothetical protein
MSDQNTIPIRIDMIDTSTSRKVGEWPRRTGDAMLGDSGGHFTITNGGW